MNAVTPARAAKITAALKELYPDAVCALDWSGQRNPDLETSRRCGWRLLVMARLSAQCTDARVNLVCRELFRLYPTPEALAAAPQQDVEAVIRPCGLFHAKASSIRAACGILSSKWNGVVPENMDDLLSLPGVGRKIANLLRGDLYGQPGIVADTHCIRICGRLGFYPEEMKDPVRAERILSPIIPPGEQSDFCHRIVSFGRDICTARAPSCKVCPLRTVCAHGSASAE
jgi:endonuclease III